MNVLFYISASIKVIKMWFSPKDSTFIAEFRNRKLQKNKKLKLLPYSVTLKNKVFVLFSIWKNIN